MKKLLIISFLFFLNSCRLPSQQERGFSPDQIRIKNMVDRYALLYYAAPNEMIKRDIRKLYVDTISRFIADSLKFRIRNSKIKLTQLETTPVQNVIAFHASFKDSIDNEYWMEFDYKEDEKDMLYQNPAYKVLKNMTENVDTVVSFFFMGEVEWADSYSDRLKIRVVPFPKNYNFDSSKAANAKK